MLRKNTEKRLNKTLQPKGCILLLLPQIIGMGLATEISKRRTFGIISHPDAGKTTLTEKLYSLEEPYKKPEP